MKGTNVGETCGCWFFFAVCTALTEYLLVLRSQQICVTHHNMFAVKHHSSTALLLTPDSFAN